MNEIKTLYRYGVAAHDTWKEYQETGSREPVIKYMAERIRATAGPRALWLIYLYVMAFCNR